MRTLKTLGIGVISVMTFVCAFGLVTAISELAQYFLGLNLNGLTVVFFLLLSYTVGSLVQLYNKSYGGQR